MNKSTKDIGNPHINPESRDVFKSKTQDTVAETHEEKFEKHEAQEMIKAIEEETKKQQEKVSPQPELVAVKKVPIPVGQKSQTLEAIEDILEEDLKDVFPSLPIGIKNEFKTKGEITAIKIEEKLQKTKIKVKEILKLIVDWLKIIPGVSKYFLEQEAKIKTDKILKLKQASSQKKEKR
ncbi:hypothetical protein KKA15_00470 [Patescibacteria group bacterium]|nr:hypothetical protein [Patescibacteria group bacterium]